MFLQTPLVIGGVSFIQGSVDGALDHVYVMVHEYSVFGYIPQNKKSSRLCEAFVADRTGLEPATSAVTGRHSNRLNYRSFQLGVQM